MDLGRRYRSIYLAGPTFELLPNETARRAMEAFRLHLAPGATIWQTPETVRSLAAQAGLAIRSIEPERALGSGEMPPGAEFTAYLATTDPVPGDVRSSRARHCDSP